MSRGYFVCDKWNWDPSARRQAIRGCKVLAGAREHVLATGADVGGFDLTEEAFAAVQLLEAASKRVAAAETLAHRIAREADERDRGVSR